jgi:hypothetical protein
VTDGIARDQKERLHEVLMATRVPTAAYVWGRFLAMLTASVGLAVLVLLAFTSMGRLLARLHPDIPSPSLGNTLVVWAIVILPATILLTGVGFTLGTLWPRRSTTMMLGMLVVWVMLYAFGSLLFGLPGHFYVYLDPTSTGILGTVYPVLLQNLQSALANVPVNQRSAVVLEIQKTLPDLSAWLIPHIGLALLGIAVVEVAAASFKRFRDVLS